MAVSQKGKLANAAGRVESVIDELQRKSRGFGGSSSLLYEVPDGARNSEAVSGEHRLIEQGGAILT